jgi:ParB/RepB/Spo0J family partition protein
VPDFETRRTTVPPFAPPIRSTRNADDEFDLAAVANGTGDVALQREGLPPGYRMRHEPHYVEQLAARAPGVQVRAIPIREIDAERLPAGQDLDALVRSIDTVGILQPLHVRNRAGRFELVAGSRRLAAAVAAGLSEVPCIVHTIDEARASQLREADNLRAPIEPAPAPAAPAENAPASLEEVRRSLSTIESCLHLLAGSKASLRDRVALDLVRTEAHRAHRLVQSLYVLGAEPTMAPTVQSCRALVEQALQAIEPERRLSGIHLSVDIEDGRHEAPVDPDAFSTALTAAIGGMMALLQQGRGPSMQVRVSTNAGRQSVLIEIAQQSVGVPEAALARFFDAGWTERPGGYQAAIELAAARKIVELHGGSIELTAGARGGCRMVLAVPGTATP